MGSGYKEAMFDDVDRKFYKSLDRDALGFPKGTIEENFSILRMARAQNAARNGDPHAWERYAPAVAKGLSLLGADVAVDSRADDLAAALRDANGGRGVDIVLEMTGGPVFDQSLDALAPLGRLAVFGQAGRTAPSPIDAGRLMARSTAVIGFWLVHIAQRPELLARAVNDLMQLIATRQLRPVVGETYPLAAAADAHRALLDRSSVGKLVLDPQR